MLALYIVLIILFLVVCILTQEMNSTILLGLIPLLAITVANRVYFGKEYIYIAGMFFKDEDIESATKSETKNNTLKYIIILKSGKSTAIMTTLKTKDDEINTINKRLEAFL